MNLPFDLAAGWIVGLAVAGMFQWLILWGRVSRAAWWLLGNFEAWDRQVEVAAASP